MSKDEKDQFRVKPCKNQQQQDRCKPGCKRRRRRRRRSCGRRRRRRRCRRSRSRSSCRRRKRRRRGLVQCRGQCKRRSSMPRVNSDDDRGTTYCGEASNSKCECVSQRNSKPILDCNSSPNNSLQNSIQNSSTSM